jgi:DNA-binding SARP family transcriptional activator
VESAQQLIASVSPLLRDPAVTPLTQFFWWARLAPYHLFQADGAKADHALDCAEALTCDLKSHAGQLLMNGFRITTALLRHDVLGAESFAAELLRIARPGQAFHDGLSSFARFQLAANRGEAEEMLVAIRLAVEAFERGGNAYIAVEFRLPLAYALIDRGFYAEAQRHIDKTARQLTGTFLHHYSNGLPLLEAYGALRQGDSERCHRVLGEALPAVTGKAGGRFYTLFQGRMLPMLCDEALRAGVAVGSAQQLIRQLGLQPVSRDVENWPWPIRIETLGKFTLYKDGKALSFAGKVQQKPLELLKTILALGAAEVDTGAVKQLLWPDAPGDAAQNAFDITLHRLRKLLARDAAIELQHGKLTLNPQLSWVDAVALERLSHEAAGCIDWRDASERALQLYRGHFLSQDGEQPWLIEPRSRLRSKFLRLIGEAGARLEATRNWDSAILLYQRGLELDSLAEPLYRRLMVCHQQRGDRAEAINVYRRCRDSLSIVLGVRPRPRPRTCTTR